VADKTQEKSQLEGQLQSMRERKKQIFEKAQKTDEELNRIWEEERHVTERLQQIRKDTTEREKQERHAARREKAKQAAELRAEFDALINENAQIKREVQVLSEGKDGKYLEKLKANLQRIQIFSEKQEDEMKRKEEDNVNLARRNKCLEDDISAARQVSVETHLRQLDELHSQTEETTELKETLMELQRQQQQPTEEEDNHHHHHRQGKFYSRASACGGVE